MDGDADELDVYLILFYRGSFLFLCIKANNLLNVQGGGRRADIQDVILVVSFWTKTVTHTVGKGLNDFYVSPQHLLNAGSEHE